MDDPIPRIWMLQPTFPLKVNWHRSLILARPKEDSAGIAFLSKGIIIYE